MFGNSPRRPGAPSGCATSSPRRRPRAPARCDRGRWRPARRCPSGSSVRGAGDAHRARPAWSAPRCSSAPRGSGAMSPQMATSRPAMLALVRADGEQSSSAWVGCSCAPSPALTTAAPTLLRRACAARPNCAWRMHDHVGRHRVQVARGVEQRLALGRRRGRAGDVDRVGREPLGGDLERGARARRRLEERLMTVLPRRVGTFLIGGSAISRKRSPRSRICAMSSADERSMPSR